MKKIYYGLMFVVSGLVSCKEVPIIVDKTERGSDTTYMATVEAAQPKMFLIEEPSGVRCVNCPEGTAMLKEANTSGAFAGKLAVVTMHAGAAFTRPIDKDGKVSKYDFRTEVGDQILTTIFGGDVGKPCAGFDRLPIGVSASNLGKILDFRGSWLAMLDKANTENGTPPVNVSVTPKLIEANKYEIEVKVSYTQEMTGKQAITVYILEDHIEDYQEFPSPVGIKMYSHNNIFRGVVSPFNGLEILPGMTIKEAGRVAIQNFVLNIDPADAFQGTWNLDNVRVLAFVHQVDAGDQTVHQTAYTKLR